MSDYLNSFQNIITDKTDSLPAKQRHIINNYFEVIHKINNKSFLNLCLKEAKSEKEVPDNYQALHSKYLVYIIGNIDNILKKEVDSKEKLLKNIEEALIIENKDSKLIDTDYIKKDIEIFHELILDIIK